jgi:hypothetical protein
MDIWEGGRGAGRMLELYQRKGEGQGTNLSVELSVNKHRKESED